jgi:hypothetical protein
MRDPSRKAVAGLVLVLAVLTMPGYPGTSAATEIKTLGRLEIPPDAAVMSVCTDPLVQEVLSEDLRGHPRSGVPIMVTVTVNARALAPGVSIQDLSPGDPSVTEMLKDLGAQPPPLGDTGNKPLEDPYTSMARRQTLNHEDPMTQQFRAYLNHREEAANPPSSYDKIPTNQLYQTAIVARASASDSASELKVVALVEAGDDVEKGKRLVAEAIADAILH